MTERKKIRRAEDPQIPVTPMLDMAFQLLTFFVLTYKPAPAEVQYTMNLLPPQPATSITAEAPTDKPSDNLPASLRTLPTILRAGEGGRLAQIMVGEATVPTNPKELELELDKYFQNPDLPFDQTILKVDPRLKYSELMKVMNAFMNAFLHAKKPPNITFEELVPGEGG
ncbi:MAG: ExbD/TolR family protein [Isosphaerales bacterium]